jgi:hypothetical protein
LNPKKKVFLYRVIEISKNMDISEINIFIIKMSFMELSRKR